MAQILGQQLYASVVTDIPTAASLITFDRQKVVFSHYYFFHCLPLKYAILSFSSFVSMFTDRSTGIIGCRQAIS